MWASLLLAGFLSGGWWGEFAFAAAPPANRNILAERILKQQEASTRTTSISQPLAQMILNHPERTNARLEESPLTRRPRHSSSQDTSISEISLRTAAEAAAATAYYPPSYRGGEIPTANDGRFSRSTKQRKNRVKADSPREQRRGCKIKGTCRGQNWCPDMDIGNRAYLAPTVFEGKVRSMSSVRKPGSNYAVTFEVKHVYKSQPGFTPLLKNDSVRLHFRDKTASTKSTICRSYEGYDNNTAGKQQQRGGGGSSGGGGGGTTAATAVAAGGGPGGGGGGGNQSGVVRANIKRGKVYLVFVNRVGLRNFTILGEPVVCSKKNEQAVQAVVRSDYVRAVSLSELRDSIARLRDRVKLVCRTRGSPPPRVHWLKDGIPLQPRKGLKIQHKRRRSKIVIASAKLEDSGRYECIAESTSGHRASLAAQLLVAHDTGISETTTAAWPRQEQPCPIAGDFCMNGGTCLFFETVGEPACRCADGFTGLRCETKDISTGSVYNRRRAPFSCKLGISTLYYC